METISVWSTKGGCGKTTVAIGLASALTGKGYRVGVLDADFTAPNVLVALGQEGARPTLEHGDVIVPAPINGLRVLSWGMLWPSKSAVLIEDSQVSEDDLRHAVALIKAQKYDAAISFLTWLADNPGGATSYMQALLRDGTVDWSNVDYLIIDTPPTTSGVIKAVAESSCTGAVIITQPSPLALADVRRTLDLMAKRSIPVFGIVNNMTRDKSELPNAKVESFALEYGVPVLLHIPYSTGPRPLEALRPYFAELASKILKVKPVTLEKHTLKEEEWQPTLKAATNLARLLNALKKRQ